MKTNMPHYYKDQESGAVLNTNTAELEQYYAQRKRLKENEQNKEKLNNLEEKVDKLESKLDLILEKLAK